MPHHRLRRYSGAYPVSIALMTRGLNNSMDESDISLEEALDALFATPLTEFTAARDLFVAAFKKNKQTEAAARIQQARKPTAAVWALNQLSRHQPKELERLLETDRRLGQIDDPTNLRATLTERRKIVAKLTSTATGILKMAGSPAGAAVADKIALSLQSAGSDAAGAELLSSGRLVRELAPGELGKHLPAPAPITPLTPITADQAPDQASRRRLAELVTKRDQAVAEAERLTQRSEEMAKDLESVRANVEAALRFAAEAQRAVIATEKDLKSR